jgi:chromosome segregation ATPase
VLNLEELVHDLGGVRKELEGRNAQCEELTRRLRGVTGQLEATEISKKALELDLATNKKIGAESREEIKGLNQKIADMESELLDVSEQLEEQQVESADLRGRNKRLEQDLKSQVANNKTIMAELEASRKALHDVRTVATRTGKRVQTRHFESSTKTDGEETSTPVEE